MSIAMVARLMATEGREHMQWQNEVATHCAGGDGTYQIRLLIKFKLNYERGAIVPV